MTPRVVRSVEPDAWWKLAASCPEATFFESPLWHRLVTGSHDRWKESNLGLIEDGQLVAVLPCVTKTGRPWGARTSMSTFGGCYGGVTRQEGAGGGTGIGRLWTEALSEGVGSLRVTGNPFRKVREAIPDSADLVEEDFTQVVRLDRPFEEVLEDYSSSRRAGVEKAVERGVTVRKAETPDGYRAHFSAYQASLDRWGVEPGEGYPWALFANGFELASEHPEHLQLWLAEVDGSVASGAWVFYWNRHAVWWHGAAHEEYFDDRPNDLLITRVMQDARRRGYELFDFNPSGGHEGVETYKRQFGAEKLPVLRWRLETLPFRALRRTRRAFGKVTSSLRRLHED